MDKPELNVEIALSEPVALTFSLKYLVNFCKASGLSSTVKLCLSNEVPLLVEYTLASNSYLRFYLAPKVVCPVYSVLVLWLMNLRSAMKNDGVVKRRTFHLASYEGCFFRLVSVRLYDDDRSCSG